MRAAVRLLSPAFLLCAAGCVEPDLGDVPFYCNHGTPACPEGYQCQEYGKAKVCVKEGASYQPDIKIAGKDAGKDVGQITFDGLKDKAVPDAPADIPQVDSPPGPDMYKPDLYPPTPKDKGGPAPDVPHLGCQSNAECKKKDPQYPCCCPMPLVPFIWGCLPLCLNPICLPL